MSTEYSEWKQIYIFCPPCDTYFHFCLSKMQFEQLCLVLNILQHNRETPLDVTFFRAYDDVTESKLIT